MNSQTLSLEKENDFSISNRTLKEPDISVILPKRTHIPLRNYQPIIDEIEEQEKTSKKDEEMTSKNTGHIELQDPIDLTVTWGKKKIHEAQFNISSKINNEWEEKDITDHAMTITIEHSPLLKQRVESLNISFDQLMAENKNPETHQITPHKKNTATTQNLTTPSHSFSLNIEDIDETIRKSKTINLTQEHQNFMKSFSHDIPNQGKSKDQKNIIQNENQSKQLLNTLESNQIFQSPSNTHLSTSKTSKKTKNLVEPNKPASIKEEIYSPNYLSSSIPPYDEEIEKQPKLNKAPRKTKRNASPTSLVRKKLDERPPFNCNPYKPQELRKRASPIHQCFASYCCTEEKPRIRNLFDESPEIVPQSEHKRYNYRIMTNEDVSIPSHPNESLSFSINSKTQNKDIEIVTPLRKQSIDDDDDENYTQTETIFTPIQGLSPVQNYHRNSIDNSISRYKPDFYDQSLDGESALEEKNESRNEEEICNSKKESTWMFISVPKHLKKNDDDFEDFSDNNNSYQYEPNFSKIMAILHDNVPTTIYRQLMLALSKHKKEKIVLLLNQKILGAYYMNNQQKFHKVWGEGPEIIQKKDISKFLTYNYKTKQFSECEPSNLINCQGIVLI